MNEEKGLELQRGSLSMVRGLDLSREVATPVRRYYEIESDAILMLRMIEQPFKGHYSAGYALHHAQVRTKPYNFFVVHPDLVNKPEETERAKDWKQAFPHQVIINPEILERPETISKKVKDLPELAELTNKDGQNVKAKDIINHANFEEGCLSFPYRKARNVNRALRIQVKYQVPGMLGMKTKKLWIEGLAAHIFQHEFDHTNGNNIYFGR